MRNLFRACEQGNERGKDKDKQCVNTRNTDACSRSHIAVEKQYVLHVFSVCLYPYLSSMQSTCAVLHYHIEIDS